MDNTSFINSDEAREQSRNRYILAIFLKLLWTLLTLLILIGVLLPLTIFLSWWTLILPCLIGLLTGISITIGVSTSLQNRALITLLLGVLTLPGIAVYLSFMAGSSPKAFDDSSSTLMPFVAYTLATLIGGLTIVKIWQHMPIREQNETTEKEPALVLPQAKKEHTSHERPNLERAS